MQEVVVNLMTSSEFYHANTSPMMAKRIFASLSADPWTVEELQMAFGRYSDMPRKSNQILDWRPGLCDVGRQAPVLWIDVVSQLANGRGLPFGLEHRGTVPFRSFRLFDFDKKRGPQIPFHLDGDWCFTGDLEDFPGFALAKREFKTVSRNAAVRHFLYDSFPRFAFPRLLCEIQTVSSIQDEQCEEIIRRVHLEWFLRACTEFGGRCFRDWIQDNRNQHVVEDLRNQAMRWSMLDLAPPAITRNSHAYGHAGFGLHETWLYFNYQRAILHEGVSRAFEAARGTLNIDGEIEHLNQFGQDWLHQPDHDSLHGQTPASFIDNERRRLPEVLPETEYLSHPECPICNLLAADHDPFGPTFFHLELSEEMREPPFGLAQRASHAPHSA